MSVAAYRMCGANGPRVAHDVPNGWGPSPTCTLIEDHAGPHRYVGQVGGGYMIEWNEACDRLDLDEAIRAACLPNMRKAFSGEPVTARDIADEQAALDSIRGSMTESAFLYDRQRLVDVLIYHQPTSTSGCICGWGVLGASHAEHVVAVYEDSSLKPDAWRRD